MKWYAGAVEGNFFVTSIICLLIDVVSYFLTSRNKVCVMQIWVSEYCIALGEESLVKYFPYHYDMVCLQVAYRGDSLQI